MIFAGLLFAATILSAAGEAQFIFDRETLNAASVAFEAEAGVPGSDYVSTDDGTAQFIAIQTDTLNRDSPGSGNRVATCKVIFPAAGTYNLYARVRVKVDAADDSFFYGNGFGIKSPTNSNDWNTVNDLYEGGYDNPWHVVAGSGSAGIGLWKWLNVSQLTNSMTEPAITFTVTASNLVQTFQIGARENGLDIDRLVFGNSSCKFMVADLDAAGSGTSPPLPKHTAARIDEIKNSDPTAPDPINAQVDKLFARWDHIDSPGAAIVVVKDGAVVYQHGYGYANLEHSILITPQTAFDVASVAKQFTGLSIAILIEQGKLSLDDDVRKYLPDMPDFGKTITIGNLLHHTSGLRDWPETFLLSDVDFEAPISFEMILEMVRRQRELDFAPGEEFQYCNTGYSLLAATIAKVTGKSFRAWTDTNLFQPLGMKHTHVCDNAAEIVPDLAESYNVGGKPGRPHRVISQVSGEGSSSLFISAEDMGKWLLNFETAKVGGRAAIELMCRPGKLNNGTNTCYGFGIFDDDYHGNKMFGHTGGWAAYRSVTIIIPEKRFAVAVLANAANMDSSERAMKIADIYLGTSDTAKSDKNASNSPAAVKADPAAWDAFLGTYRLRAGWLLTITREGDTLMTQATHEDKFKMTPTGTNTFFVEGYHQSVEFVRQKSGMVTNLIYRGINAPKLDLPEITPAQLAAYVGDYWSEELRVARRIEIHDGKLAIRHRSGVWLHFLATGPDRFDADFDGGTGAAGATFGLAGIQFTRNAAGEVTEAKISGGRVRNIRYTRTTLPQASVADRTSLNKNTSPDQ
jgi:CubicO group peptidase (beta-lactamase class C family)